MPSSPRPTDVLILESARQELARSGILGLRVAEVASGAHCSVTNIYRYFGDRDGLLARVLGDMYEELTLEAVHSYLALFEGRSDVTVRELATAIPLPTTDESIKLQVFRLQILAAATENPKLHQRLEDITKKRRALWFEGVALLRSRMAPGEEFDERVFYAMLANHAPYYNYLLGDMKMTEEQFHDFLTDKFRANAQTNP